MNEIQKSYQKLFAAQAAAERWQDEVQGDLRIVGERYMTLWRQLNPSASWDRYPQTVEAITESGKMIHVSGYWSRRGCTDAEHCNIPKELVYASPEEREVYFANMQAVINGEKAAEDKAQEERERAKYEALRAKFEGENA